VRQSFICAFILTFFSPHQPPQSRADVIKTTVCAVSTEPNKFDGKLIEITAQFESDGIHSSVFTDKTCENFGIALFSSEHYVGEKALKNALSRGHPGTLDKTVDGTFVGRFHSHPNQVPSRVLVLEQARNISVVMK